MIGFTFLCLLSSNLLNLFQKDGSTFGFAAVPNGAEFDNSIDAGPEPHLEKPEVSDIRNLIRAYNNDKRPVCPCGLIGHTRHKRVIGGSPADIHAYPFAVSLRKTLSNGAPYPYCGGTILTERHIVTASHCLLNKLPGDLSVEVGRTNISGIETRADPFIRRVVRIERHAFYDQPTYNSDIAVLTLDRPLQFGTTINPACIPPYGSDVLDGTPGQVVGWGRLAYKGKKSETLQNVTLPIVSRTQCQKPLKHRVSTNMICAGGLEERDACVGDSGGPLVVKSRNTALLIGVVSFGKKCGLPNVYGVYTRVGLYVRFLYEKTLDSNCKPGIMSMRDYRSVGDTNAWVQYSVNRRPL
ncbi:coagulation factor IX [Galendromus occidentalis]|uniref:limulus clotting factor C n=1 Tax=Galendromus occidentalis TaxID=34638 RepID=A0AAJ6VZD8_9ACAR|nr:coagulation factor IX [Galendromus occidentalis]